MRQRLLPRGPRVHPGSMLPSRLALRGDLPGGAPDGAPVPLAGALSNDRPGGLLEGRFDDTSRGGAAVGAEPAAPVGFAGEVPCGVPAVGRQTSRLPDRLT